jgi:hypothetical protein
MKQFYLISVLCICLFSINYSQSNKLSADLNYPIPIGDNFIAENYNGIFDLGIKFYFWKISNFDFGLSGNVGYFNASIFDNDISLLMLRPRISAETYIGKFCPYLGIGYSFLNFSIDTESEIDKTKDGLNISFGVKYNLFYRIYLNFSYDYIHLKHEGIIQKSSYNQDINILNIGLGIQL